MEWRKFLCLEVNQRLFLGLCCLLFSFVQSKLDSKCSSSSSSSSSSIVSGRFFSRDWQFYSKAVLTEEKRELSSDEVFRVQVLGTSIMAEDLQQLEQCIIVSASPFTLSSPNHLLTHRTNKKRFFVFQNKFVLTMSSRSSLPASLLSFAVTESCGLLSQTMMQCLFRST